MKSICYLFLILIFPIICSFSFSTENKTEPEFPNVIFILAGDIGQGDIGYYHRQRTGKKEVIPTPNLDALIESGISFSDAHTNSALCSPTRYTAMTGNYTFRCYRQWGVWGACNKSGIADRKSVV